MSTNRYFVSAWNAFGVNDLIITDSHGSVIKTVPSAVFGVSVGAHAHKEIFACLYETLVRRLDAKDDLYDLIIDCEDSKTAQFVRELTLNEVIERAYATETDMKSIRLHRNLMESHV